MRTLPALALLSLTACMPFIPEELPPTPTEAVRAEIGTIGIALLDEDAEVELDAPARGWLAGIPRGFVGGLLTGLEVGGELTEGGSGDSWIGGFMVLLGLAIGVVMAVGGTVYGAFAAPSAEEVMRAEAAIMTAVAEIRVQERAGFRGLEIAKRAGYAAMPVEPHGRTKEGERTYGAGTVLEVRVTHVDLNGPWTLNPDLQIHVRVKTRLISGRDGSVIHSANWVYSGPEMDFGEWGRGGARHFRHHLSSAIDETVDRAVEEVLMLDPIPRRPTHPEVDK